VNIEKAQQFLQEAKEVLAKLEKLDNKSCDPELEFDSIESNVWGSDVSQEIGLSWETLKNVIKLLEAHLKG
jgi:hypothetical protein